MKRAYRAALNAVIVLPLLFVFFGSPAANGAQDTARPYRILVTNDDGVRAPGILALANALKAIGDVTIAAPEENQSGKGHSISITDPIYVDPVTLPGGWTAFGLTATPASCVKVAIAALMPQKPDLVVSGINRGYNLGVVAYLSGTVGAAREAALQGIPAIATSLDVTGHPNYEPAARVTARIADLIKHHPLGRGVFLNVNIPSGPVEAMKGIRVATQSALRGTERFDEQKSPRGRRYFWNVYDDARADVEGTDVWVTAQGYTAVTPLKATEFDADTFRALKDLVK